jgi:hypothetical protein
MLSFKTFIVLGFTLDLQRNIGENLCKLRLGKDFLYITPIA